MSDPALILESGELLQLLELGLDLKPRDPLALELHLPGGKSEAHPLELVPDDGLGGAALVSGVQINQGVTNLPPGAAELRTVDKVHRLPLPSRHRIRAGFQL